MKILGFLLLAGFQPTEGFVAEFGTVSDIISTAISVGSATRGAMVTTSVGHLGLVENYMKYPLTVEYTKVYSGELSTPYHMVQPGTSEKFAGETEWHSRLRGVSSQVRWQIKGYQIKFGIYSPYSQMWSSNVIQVTICAPGESGCNVRRWITGWKPTDTRRMAVEYFEDSFKPIRLCHGDICLYAMFGSSSVAQATIRIYPRNFYDLVEIPHLDQRKYENFIRYSIDRN